MSRGSIPLEIITVPNPCPASWEAMRGGDEVRFCKHCQKNVYDLSAMDRAQAEALVGANEGHMCVRFYRRADGTVVTSDCKGAWKKAKRKLALLTSAAASVMACGIAVAATGDASHRTATIPLRQFQPIRWCMNFFAPPSVVAGGIMIPPTTQPTTQPAIMGDMIQGGICPPTTQPSAPTTQPVQMGEMIAPKE
jgi:hypothetical protein